MNKGYLTSGRTKESDECLTPEYAVIPLIKHLRRKGYRKIWCPFDKDDSFFVRVLKAEGFTVINTHYDPLKEEGKDFFNNNYNHIDCIVSNPPFSIKDAVLEHLYNIDKPFAVLLPQNALQSIKRVKMFIDNGLEYLGFNRRICFYINGNMEEWASGNHFASGYFCKDVLPSKMVLEELNPIQRQYKD